MKRRRKAIFTPFVFNSKWSRRGKILADFLVSFLLVVFVRVCVAIFAVAKWLSVSAFFLAAKLFARRAVTSKFLEKEMSGAILPDRFSRLEAFMQELEGKPIEHNLSVGSIIDLTAGCTRVRIARIVRTAEKIARTRIGDATSSLITEQDLIAATRSEI